MNFNFTLENCFIVLVGVIVLLLTLIFRSVEHASRFVSTPRAHRDSEARRRIHTARFTARRTA